MRVSWRWLLLGCVWWCGLAGAGAATTWTKLQTEDFVILSDAPAKDVVEFAVGYTAFRQMLREFLAPGRTLPPSTLLLFRSRETLRSYLPRSNNRDVELVSFTTEVDAEALVALGLAGDRTQALELTYEFETMWALRRLGYFLPLWMSQGTGEVMASLQVKKNKRLLGDGPERFSTHWRRSSPLPWDRFFNLSNDSADYSGKQADGMAQTQSWALMHRILLGGEGGRERFEALAEKLRTAAGPEAVEAVIGVAPRELEKDLAKHLQRRDTIREFPFDAAQVRAAFKPTVATLSEVQVQLANLLVAAQRPEEAELQLRQAQAATPDASGVKEWLARRELRENRPEDAARLYREAIAAGSRNSAAYVVSAEQRLNASRSAGIDRPGEGGRDIEESLAEIRQAIRLNPGSVDAYRLLGRACFLHPKPTVEQAVELGRGISPNAGGDAVQFYRALHYQRLGKRAEMMADLVQLTSAKTTSSNIRRIARERLESESFRDVKQQVEALAEGKNYTEARAVVAKARQPELGRGADEQYESLGRWLTEKESWETLNALAAAEKWADLRAAAKTFLEAFPRSRVAEEVRRLDRRAAAKLPRSN